MKKELDQHGQAHTRYDRNRGAVAQGRARRKPATSRRKIDEYDGRSAADGLGQIQLEICRTDALIRQWHESRIHTGDLLCRFDKRLGKSAMCHYDAFHTGHYS